MKKIFRYVILLIVICLVVKLYVSLLTKLLKVKCLKTKDILKEMQQMIQES